VDLVPEQDWELPDLAASPFGADPTIASVGFRDGGRWLVHEADRA
jgi:glucoamylase